VDQLNTFFTLKTNHEITQAKTDVVNALQLVLDGIDLQSTVTTDGVLEKDSHADAAYAEIKTLAVAIQSSLAGSQQLPFVTPIITINLDHFFTRPPDKNSIAIDPFVLENGRIKGVESFFEQLLSETMDVHFSTSYAETFQALKKPILKVFFDEFVNFMVAGTRLGRGGSSTVPQTVAQ